jgi:hypothetical protein
MIYLGLDPGKHGAVAVICGETHEIHDMPLMREGKKEHIDLVRLFEIISGVGAATACLEKQQAYPNQGSVSNFSTGYGYGALRMGLVATKMSFEEVHPKTWQKYFGISKDTKGQSCAIAGRLFPGASLYGPKGASKDGRADALLLAEYIRRRIGGDV